MTIKTIDIEYDMDNATQSSTGKSLIVGRSTHRVADESGVIVRVQVICMVSPSDQKGTAQKDKPAKTTVDVAAFLATKAAADKAAKAAAKGKDKAKT